VPHEDTPPTFVTPTDDALDPFETLQRLTDVMQRVDQEHPDVRLLSAHIAVVVAALLNDSEDVAEENDKLTTQSRKLAARVERLEKTTGRTKQQLNQALAAAGELRTNVNAERRLRRRAEQTRDDAHRLTDVQQRPASNDDELARLQSRLQQAHAEIDKLTTALEDAENDRDTAIRDRALLAARAEERDLTEADEPPQPPAPDSFAEVLARGEHPLLVYSLDRSITDSLDRHTETSAAWRRCVTDAIATMIAYATAKAEARRTGQPAGPALADLRSFARSGDRARISPNRIALSETRAVTGDSPLRPATPVPRTANRRPQGNRHRPRAHPHRPAATRTAAVLPRPHRRSRRRQNLPRLPRPAPRQPAHGLTRRPGQQLDEQRRRQWRHNDDGLRRGLDFVSVVVLQLQRIAELAAGRDAADQHLIELLQGDAVFPVVVDLAHDDGPAVVGHANVGFRPILVAVPGVAELRQPGSVIDGEFVLHPAVDLQDLAPLTEPYEVDEVALEAADKVTVGIDGVLDVAGVQRGLDHVIAEIVHRAMVNIRCKIYRAMPSR
jgi:hypothetical protein